MTTRLNPYLSFRDNAREAMEFYKSVFGGQLDVSTFGDMQAAGESSAEQDKVMHAQLSTESGLALMGADTPAGMELNPGNNFSISLSGEDEGELRGYWDQLSAAGTVTLPLEKAPWGDSFGMCLDQYGVMWMVNIAGGQSDSQSGDAPTG